jgi:hypothetical protein
MEEEEQVNDPILAQLNSAPQKEEDDPILAQLNQESGGGASMGFTEGSQEPQEQPSQPSEESGTPSPLVEQPYTPFVTKYAKQAAEEESSINDTQKEIKDLSKKMLGFEEGTTSEKREAAAERRAVLQEEYDKKVDKQLTSVKTNKDEFKNAFNSVDEQFKTTKDELIETGQLVEMEDGTVKALTDEAAESYNAVVKARAEAAEDYNKDLSILASREAALLAEKGSFGGYLQNQVVNKFGDYMRGLTEVMGKYLIQPALEAAGAPEATGQEIRDASKRVTDPFKEGLGTKETTPQYAERIQEEDDVSSGIVGGIASIPTMITPAMTGIFFESYANAGDEVEGLNLTEGEKETYQILSGGIEWGFERAGTARVLAKNPVLKRAIIGRILPKLKKGIAGEQLNRLVASEIKKIEASGVENFMQAVVAEGGTGMGQEAGTIGLKEAFNEYKAEEIFDEGTIEEYVTQIVKAGKQEAIGAILLSGGVNVANSFSSGDMKAVTQQDLEAAQMLATDPTKAAELIREHLKGKPDAYVERVVQSSMELAEVLQKIPPQQQLNKKAISLVKEKTALQDFVEGKEDGLVAPEKARIKAIEEELAAIVTPKQNEEALEPVEEAAVTPTETTTEGATDKVNKLFDSRVKIATEKFDKAINDVIKESGLPYYEANELKRVTELRAEKDKTISDLESKRSKALKTKLKGAVKKTSVQNDKDVDSLDDLGISDEELLELEDEIGFEEKTSQAPEVLEQGMVSDGGKNYEITSIDNKKDGSKVVKAKEVIEVTEDNIEDLQSKRKAPLKVGDKVYGTTKRYIGDVAEQIAKDNAVGVFEEKAPKPPKWKTKGTSKKQEVTTPTKTTSSKAKPTIEERTEEDIEKELEEGIKSIEKDQKDFEQAILDELAAKNRNRDLVSLKGNIYQVTRKPDGTFSVSKMREDGKLIGIKSDTTERKAAIAQFKRKQTQAEKSDMTQAEKLVEDTKKESEDRILKALDKAIQDTSFTRLRGQANDVVTVLGVTAANLSLRGVRAAYKAGVSLKEAIAIQYAKIKGTGITELEFKRFVLESLKPTPQKTQQQDKDKKETEEAPIEGKKEVTNAEKTKIAEEIGKARKVKPKNIKGLLDVMGGIFGLNKKQAESASVVGDVIIGNMAKRAGISKDEMYQKIAYQKAQKAPDGSLKQMISEDADGNVIFESSVKRGLSELPNNPMTPDAWVAQISKKGGRGTQEELYVIGVLDKNSDGNYVVSQNFKDAIGWIGDKKVDLKDQKAIDGKYWKSVPKEVVEKYINDNQIEIIEIVKGESITWEQTDNKWKYKDYEIRFENGEDYAIYYDGKNFGSYASLDIAKQAMEDYINDRTSSLGDTKYSQYTLEGGKNYREVLLTLPRKDKITAKLNEDSPYYKWDLFDSSGIKIGSSSKNRESDAIKDVRNPNNYKSSHWDEANILAHLRLNERTLPNGERVMFIEEVQSDWAQEGKKKGFETKEVEEKRKQREEIRLELVEIDKKIEELEARKKSFESLSDTFSSQKELLQEKGRLEKQLETVRNNRDFERIEEGIRNLNKALNYKSDNIQRIDEEIYDLKYGNPKREQLRDRLYEMDNANDGSEAPDMPYKKTDQWVGMAMRRAMQMAAQEGFDRVAWVTGEQSADRYDLSKQVDRVEVADMLDGNRSVYISMKDNSDTQLFVDPKTGKILQSTDKGIDGKMLEDVVGKEISNKILNLNTEKESVISSEGLKIGGEGMKAFYNSILPKVAQKEAQRFDKSAKVKVVDFGDNTRKVIVDVQRDGSIRLINEGGGFIAEYNKNQFDEAYKEADRLNERIDNSQVVGKQLSIPITPEMRMNLNGAVPLFQGEQGAMAAADGNYVVYALTDPNISTPLHELAHVYEHYLTDKERADIESWSGHNAGTVEFSEAFARGFEKFLAGGKVNNPKLQKIFENFKEWLTEIYNGITGSEIDIELNDVVK